MGKALSIPASVLALFGAILVYGVAGSPTPDDPGIPEIIIGLLLFASAGIAALSRMQLFLRPENLFFRLLHLLFLLGLFVPTITGVLNGNALPLMLRDLLAFSFLCLPLFMAESIARNEYASRIFPWVLVFVGIIFAIRTLLPAFNIWIAQGELLYLSNSPLVLFTALFFTGLLWQLYSRLSWHRFLMSLPLLGGVAIIAAAMLLDIQRATLAAIALTLIILTCTTFIKTPRRVIVPASLFAIMIFAIYPWMSEAANAVYRKTSEVGFNMRAQELEAVLGILTQHPVTFLLGTGWGGIFASPAVGGLDVNYTHSLLSTMLLKGGVILCLFTTFVCLAALYQIVLIFQRDSAKGLTLFWPFIIPVFFYASHKSLDFGLLLLLIGVWSIERESLHRASDSCI